MSLLKNISKAKTCFSSSYSITVESTVTQGGKTLSTVSNITCNTSFSNDLNSLELKLCYTGQRCYKIPEVLIKMYGPKVNCLDLSFNELKTLKGLENFSSVRELILDNNQLSDTIVLPPLKYLHTLSLNNNKVNDIELLLEKIIRNTPNLTYLSLLGNKACPNQLSDLNKDDDDYKRYRNYVIYRLPNLHFLDSSKITNNERIEAQRSGKYTKIVRPIQNTASNENAGSPILDSLTPLPRNIRRPEDHKGAFGKLVYRYSGKQSEGNRFILNNDL